MNAQHPASAPARRRLNPMEASDFVLRCREHLDANLFGQEDGKKLLTYAYAAAHNPLRDRNKPIAFIINAGKSRTGKTHSVELLAELVHGNPKAYLRVDMAEYMDKYSLSNLKGSGRGYINNQGARDDNYSKVPADQKHDYAEFMNHNLEWSKKGSSAPISIVLLDELDKACYEVFLLLLGIMDHGKLTLGNGEVVDFTNTIFVCAANLGMAEVEREEVGGIGFGARDKKLSADEVTQVVHKALRDKAPPEFRNRVKELGGIAIYEELTREQMAHVVVRELGELQKRITSTGFHFTVGATEAARDAILDRALADNGNLANVKSEIKKEIDTVLGAEATKRTIKMGEHVTIGIEEVDGKVVYTFDVEDPMSRMLGQFTGAPQGDVNASSEAPSSEVTGEEAPATLVQMGHLLGSASNVVVLMRRPFDRKTGELAVDQLMGLGMLPDVSSIFTDLHNMTMQERMGELRLKAERFPELRRAYTLELCNENHYQTLGDESQKLIQEIVRFLGVDITDSHMTHKAPFKFVINVMALDESVQMMRIRFPRLKITARETVRQ